MCFIWQINNKLAYKIHKSTDDCCLNLYISSYYECLFGVFPFFHFTFVNYCCLGHANLYCILYNVWFVVGWLNQNDWLPSIDWCCKAIINVNETQFNCVLYCHVYVQHRVAITGWHWVNIVDGLNWTFAHK